MDERIVAFVICLSIIILIGWFFWLDAKRRQARVQATADLQNRLLEKFSSPQDVAQFLQSEGGGRFLQGLTTAVRPPTQRILTAMQVGVILGLFGLACVVLGALYGSPREPVGIIFGGLILALGVGFLISAALSYRLSKTLGLFPSEVKPPEEPS